MTKAIDTAAKRALRIFRTHGKKAANRFVGEEALFLNDYKVDKKTHDIVAQIEAAIVIEASLEAMSA